MGVLEKKREKDTFFLMGNMQFTAIMLMALLTMKLLLLPGRVATNAVLNRSRWLMVVSTALLGV